MADPFLIADQLYNLGMQYSQQPTQEPGPLGTAGYASTPFGDKLIGPSSFFGPRVVSTPQGDVYYGPSPLAGPKFGDVAPTLEQAKAMEFQPTAPASQEVPWWMSPSGQSPYAVTTFEMPGNEGGSGGGGGSGDSGR